MEKVLDKIGKFSSLLTKYIGIVIIAFSVLAFFWQGGFAWTTNYTSVFLGVAMFGMGLTIKMGDFQVVFSHPKEVIIGAIAHVHGDAACCVASGGGIPASAGSGAGCDPGRLLSGRNGE